MIKTYDVAIVGGGAVGATQAAALAKFGFSVVVIDQLPLESVMKAYFDGRTMAISQGSSNIYRGIGLWSELEPHVEPILDIRVSDDHSPWFLHYDHRDVGSDPMGYIIENVILRRKLIEHCRSFENLEWKAPAQISEFRQESDADYLTLTTGEEIKARLCIAADGRGSAMRERVDISVTTRPYGQNAVVCMIEHELPHEGVAHEHFLPTGPFAILPMQGGHRSSVVWSIKEHLSQSLIEMPEEEFAHAMQQQFGDSLGKITLASKRWCYPLSVQFATTYIEKRFVMIGDAAHVIHPIAGQGLNMGLRDVAALTEVLVETARLGLDVGGYTCLEKYQRWRRFDNMVFIGATDSLTRLFSNDFRPLRMMRDMGLGIVNKTMPVKKFFMKHAMGLSGQLPKLVSGEPL